MVFEEYEEDEEGEEREACWLPVWVGTVPRPICWPPRFNWPLAALEFCCCCASRLPGAGVFISATMSLRCRSAGTALKSSGPFDTASRAPGGRPKGLLGETADPAADEIASCAAVNPAAGSVDCVVVWPLFVPLLDGVVAVSAARVSERCVSSGLRIRSSSRDSFAR